MAKKKSTKTKGWAIAYKAENRAVKNKAIKIARHQKEHPNDKQPIGTVADYRRKKPLPYNFGSVQKSSGGTVQKAGSGRSR